MADDLEVRAWRNLAALMPYTNRVTRHWWHVRGVGWVPRPLVFIPAQRRPVPPGLPTQPRQRP